LIVIGILGLTGMSYSNKALQTTATDQMPSATHVANSEIYAARARLALDRAALMSGTPEAKSVLDRAKMLYATSESWWQKYLALSHGADENRKRSTNDAPRSMWWNAWGVVEAGQRRSTGIRQGTSAS
jgi:methyl-accepting chemotaxis protein-1 (serine sensor receptor)